MRLIDADKIEYWEHTECGGHGEYYRVRSVTDKEIAEMPTVDAVEVVHGSVIEYDTEEWYSPVYECKECNCLMMVRRYSESFILPFNDTEPVFCSGCGAKLDGGLNNDEKR